VLQHTYVHSQKYYAHAKESRELYKYCFALFLHFAAAGLRLIHIHHRWSTVMRTRFKMHTQCLQAGAVARF